VNEEPYREPVSMPELLIRYVLLVALLPSLIFFILAFFICKIECFAAPLFALLAAPVISLFVLLPIAISTYRRAGDLDEEDDVKAVRLTVVSSIIWGPILAKFAFGIVIDLL